MKVLSRVGRPDIAEVYLLDFGNGRILEAVEALQPPLPRERKWVLLVSTMFGCPINCPMCDAGGPSRGPASADEIWAQIDELVLPRYPDSVVPCRQFKIQFARMGEPALNPAVLDVIEALPGRFQAPGLMPAVSTVAPAGRDAFFERLRDIKLSLYSGGRFQFQFSIHTTDESLRRKLVPCRTWDFGRMAEFGERFFVPGDRKIALNFALVRGAAIDPDVLRRHFDPAKFLIKVTPLNPTHKALAHGLRSLVDPLDPAQVDLTPLRAAGYDVLLSIGEPEENRIGSNCGQYVRTHLAGKRRLENGYSYWDAGSDSPAGSSSSLREASNTPPPSE